MFIVDGGLVEYWWPALAFSIAIWSYRKQPAVPAVFVAFVSCALLGLINGNQMALASFLILWAALYVNLPCPRLRWFFYAFYPAHLSLIWLLDIPMHLYPTFHIIRCWDFLKRIPMRHALLSC